MGRWRVWSGSVISLLLFALAIAVLYHIDNQYHWRDVAHELRQISPLTLLLCVGATALSYGLLTLYDTLAVRQVGGKIPYPKIALTSFVAYTFSNTLGFALLTGTSVRFRFYSALGLSTSQITRVVFFCSVTFFLGLFLIGGLALGHVLVDLPVASVLPEWLRPGLHLLGDLAVALALGYLLLPLVRHKPLHWRGHELAIPRFTDTAAQMVVAILDWSAAALVFYLLLPPVDGLTFFHVLAIFVVANMLGVMAHVPGGIGVFESVVTLLLAPQLPAPQILGALLFYRVLYYLLPFAVALVLFVGMEWLWHHKRIASLEVLASGIRRMLPAFISLAVFAAGTLLLFSGATPAIDSRLSWLEAELPLPLLELSHLMGSLSGALLLLLARSLYRRYDSAYRVTQCLLLGGIIFSLLKGLDWEEAMVLGVLLGLMLPCKALFYRRGSLIHAPFSPGWLLAFVAVLTGVVWLLLFSYRHVDYSHELWWAFSAQGEASRALRACGSVLGLAVCAAVAYLLGGSHGRHCALPDAAQLEKARQLIRQSGSTHSHLALLGDKSLMFHESGKAFLMYGISGRSWVVMGDPVGDEGLFDELLWAFREECDRNDSWPVFYQVKPTLLPACLDLGLRPFKLGEEARVDLATFSLTGSKLRNLRQSHAKALRDGLSFEVVLPEMVGLLMVELREISDAWLHEKQGREKGFSVGYFHEAYLTQGPMALVRCKGELAGFANLWTSDTREELSVDLMRYHPARTNGSVMDFLFTELMLWGQAQGYHRFNLGMAPMAGFATHPLAPFWNRLASTLYARGNRFYNFQGLHRYKDKFNPEWEPRYLVCPSGISLPLILTNLVSLISRGALGVLHK